MQYIVTGSMSARIFFTLKACISVIKSENKTYSTQSAIYVRA